MYIIKSSYDLFNSDNIYFSVCERSRSYKYFLLGGDIMNKFVQIVCGVKVPQGIIDKVSLSVPMAEGEVTFEDLTWVMKFVSPFELQVSAKHYLGTEVVATLDANIQSHTGWFSLDKSSEVYCLGIVEGA